MIRIALIGLGSRGIKTLERYAYIPNAEIRYIADLDANRLEQANNRLRESQRPAATALIGADAWRTACRMDDVDLVYICTEWSTHTPMAVFAMEQGKDVAVEVPAATTLDECWLLVETAERTGRQCFMTENCCYDLFHLCTLEMHRRSLFGTLTHLEGGYIHNLCAYDCENGRPRPLTDTRRNWMERSCESHGGNPYPTHGIGPVTQFLKQQGGDRMKSIVSLTAAGHEQDGELLGRVNSSLIQTEHGVTILLQLDVTTPRPYSRIQALCGTDGFAQKYPIPQLQLRGAAPLTGDKAMDALKPYATSPAACLWHEGHTKGVPNEMNYAMDARLIHCLSEGLPLDFDVYDAAEWSCLAELSKRSAEQGGMPVAIPDFRKGRKA